MFVFLLIIIAHVLGVCFTQDIGINVRHMNNARFVRELDFSRFHFYDRTGLYAEMCRRHTDTVQGATSIRYRRTIPTFTFYKIMSQVSGFIGIIDRLTSHRAVRLDLSMSHRCHKRSHKYLLPKGHTHLHLL